MSSSRFSFQLPQTFRAVSHRNWCFIIWGLCLVFAGWTLTDIQASTAPTITFFVTLAYVMWLVMWKPNVTISEDDVTIRNPFTETTYPFEVIESVETQYQYALVVEGKRCYSWALPAPSFLGTAAIGLSRRWQTAPQSSKDVSGDGTVRVGDLSSNDCGGAAGVTRAVIAERKPVKGTPPAQVTTRRYTTRMAIAAALILITGLLTFL